MFHSHRASADARTVSDRRVMAYKIVVEKVGAYSASEIRTNLEEAVDCLIKDILNIEGPMNMKTIAEFKRSIDPPPVLLERGDHKYSIIEWNKSW